MRRKAVLFALLLLAPFSTFAATVDVAVGPGLSFTPSTVNIFAGDTVRWNWAGAAHSSTSNSSMSLEAWDSGLMVTGTFSHTFTNVGDWPYYCTLHSFPGGTAMNGVVHVSAVLPPAPTLSDVNPTSGPTAGGTSVTLTGSNFVIGCIVSFGGTAAMTTTIQTATTIVATTPAHSAGSVSVAVACPAGTATLTNAFTFADSPTITGVQPLSAPPGLSVTISGAAFQNGATVRFGGTSAPSVTFVNSGSLVATVPNIAPGAATITVTNPDTQSAAFSGFSVVSAAAIPLLDPRVMWMLVAVLASVGVIVLNIKRR